MKDHVATYPGLPLGECRLHEQDCRHLRPTSVRPQTGSRRATPLELATQPHCKVC